MSIRVMSKVWDTSSHKLAELLCLLAIADHADDSGVAWPSRKHLAKKSRCHERYVRKLTTALVDSGELLIDIRRGRGNSNRYLITLGLEREEIAETLRTHHQFNLSQEDADALASEVIKNRPQGPLLENRPPGSGLNRPPGSGLNRPPSSHEPELEPSLEPSCFKGEDALEEDPDPDHPVKEEEQVQLPVNLPGWLAGLQEEKNKTAWLMLAYKTLAPEAPPLSYGKLGALAKRSGGYERFLQYLFEFSGTDLTDPVTYIAGTHIGRTGQKKSEGQNGRLNTELATEEEGMVDANESVEDYYARQLRLSGLG